MTEPRPIPRGICLLDRSITIVGLGLNALIHLVPPAILLYIILFVAAILVPGLRSIVPLYEMAAIYVGNPCLWIVVALATLVAGIVTMFEVDMLICKTYGEDWRERCQRRRDRRP